MNETEKRIRGSHSEAFKKLNPGLFGPAVGAIQGKIIQPDQGKALERDVRRPEEGKASRLTGVRRRRLRQPVLRVSLIALTHQRIDGDNLQCGLKHFRDRIAEEFGLDDAERFVDWQYASVPTRGEQGVIVRIEAI